MSLAISLTTADCDPHDKPNCLNGGSGLERKLAVAFDEICPMLLIKAAELLAAFIYEGCIDCRRLRASRVTNGAQVPLCAL